MASKMFLYALDQIVRNNIDLETDTIQVALIMTNNASTTANSLTVDADDGTVAVINDITTLAECDDTGTGPGYARQDITEVVTLDETNNRIEFGQVAATVFGAGNTMNGDGSYDYEGALIYKFVATDADSIPIAYIDFSSDVALAATQVTVTWNAEGIIQFAGP